MHKLGRPVASVGFSTYLDLLADVACCCLFRSGMVNEFLIEDEELGDLLEVGVCPCTCVTCRDTCMPSST